MKLEIPDCVVCGDPTMEGDDDRPWGQGSDTDRHVCSAKCELKDKAEHDAVTADDLRRFLTEEQVDVELVRVSVVESEDEQRHEFVGTPVDWSGETLTLELDG